MSREEDVKQLFDKKLDLGSIKSIEEVESGISHSTFFVRSDKEVVVKIEEGDWSALPDFERGFVNDALIINEVKKKSNVPVPEVYCFDNSKNEFNFRYMIMEKVEGKNFTDFFSYKDDKKLIKKLGKAIADLHTNLNYDSTGTLVYDSESESLNVEKEGWINMFKEIVWILTGHLEDSEYAEFKPRIRNLVEENIDLIKEVDNPSLVHQELSGGNILVSQKEIKAIIDWERAFSGDPEYDLFATEIQITQKIDDNNAGLRENTENIRKLLRDSYREERDLREGWEKRRYLYYLPFLTQMMWVMEDREGKFETLEKQFEEIERKLGDEKTD